MSASRLIISRHSLWLASSMWVVVAATKLVAQPPPSPFPAAAPQAGAVVRRDGADGVPQAFVQGAAEKVTVADLQRRIRLELAFLRRAVQLTAEQEKAVDAISPASLDAMRLQTRKTVPGVEFQEERKSPKDEEGVLDPLRMRQAERNLEKVIDSILTEEQKQKYMAEKAEREAFRRETVIRGLLVILDQRLSLSSQQVEVAREKLAQWNELTTLDLAPYETSNNYLPPLPSSLNDGLSENQRRILDSMPRIQFGGRSPPALMGGEILIER